MSAHDSDEKLQAGLAAACIRLGELDEALAALARAEQRTGRVMPEWLAMRAHIYGRLRNPAAAETALTQLLAIAPGEPEVIYQLGMCLLAQSRPGDALEVLGAPAGRANARCNALEIDCLIALWRIAEARQLFASAIEAARNPSDIAELLPPSGRLFGKGEAFRMAMQRAHARLTAIGTRAPANLVCSLLYGMEDFERLKQLLDALAPGSLAPSVERCARAALGDLPTGPKIFGIGLSRTGTTSLNNALLLLGIDAHHWLHPITTHMLDQSDVPLFAAQTDGWPSANFEELANAEPDALFILTDRDTEEWERSYIKHARRRFSLETIGELQSRLRDTSQPCPFGESWRQLHEAIYGAHDSFQQAFEAHRSRVLSFFADKPGRLLHLPVNHTDPWRALCGFLGKPIPAQPYPHRNRGQ